MGVELGIGDSLLIKAIEQATGRSNTDIKAAYEEEGDLGLIAQSSASRQRTLGFAAKPKPLTSSAVLTTLRDIANMSGNRSQDRKIGIIKKLLVASNKKS